MACGVLCVSGCGPEAEASLSDHGHLDTVVCGNMASTQGGASLNGVSESEEFSLYCGSLYQVSLVFMLFGSCC